MRLLITGGARSGKSVAAERRLSSFNSVRYVATSPNEDGDGEWSARVAAHQARRPDTWSTVETTDLVGQIMLAAPGTPVLIDCLTLWLAGRLDDLSAWRSPVSPTADVRTRGANHALDTTRDQGVAPTSAQSETGSDPIAVVIGQEITELARAIGDCRGDLVLVTNEVGSGIVPATTSGRIFRDLMGICNAAVAAACDEVILVVAGCELVVKRDV